MQSLETMPWRKTLIEYVNMYVYTHICEELYSKTQSTKLGLTSETILLFNGAYRVLERSSSHIYIFIYMHLDIHRECVYIYAYI